VKNDLREICDRLASCIDEGYAIYRVELITQDKKLLWQICVRPEKNAPNTLLDICMRLRGFPDDSDYQVVEAHNMSKFWELTILPPTEEVADADN